MRSSFVALSARVYSRARSNGCTAGSRFRGWRATSLPGVCMELVERVSALIFCVPSVRDPTHHQYRAILTIFSPWCPQARWEDKRKRNYKSWRKSGQKLKSADDQRASVPACLVVRSWRQHTTTTSSHRNTDFILEHSQSTFRAVHQ